MRALKKTVKTEQSRTRRIAEMGKRFLTCVVSGSLLLAPGLIKQARAEVDETHIRPVDVVRKTIDDGERKIETYLRNRQTEATPVLEISGPLKFTARFYPIVSREWFEASEEAEIPIDLTTVGIDGIAYTITTGDELTQEEHTDVRTRLSGFKSDLITAEALAIGTPIDIPIEVGEGEHEFSVTFPNGFLEIIDVQLPDSEQPAWTEILDGETPERATPAVVKKAVKPKPALSILPSTVRVYGGQDPNSTVDINYAHRSHGRDSNGETGNDSHEVEIMKRLLEISSQAPRTVLVLGLSGKHVVSSADTELSGDGLSTSSQVLLGNLGLGLAMASSSHSSTIYAFGSFVKESGSFDVESPSTDEDLSDRTGFTRGGGGFRAVYGYRNYLALRAMLSTDPFNPAEGGITLQIPSWVKGNFIQIGSEVYYVNSFQPHENAGEVEMRGDQGNTVVQGEITVPLVKAGRVTVFVAPGLYAETDGHLLDGTAAFGVSFPLGKYAITLGGGASMDLDNAEELGGLVLFRIGSTSPGALDSVFDANADQQGFGPNHFRNAAARLSILSR